MAKIKSIPEQHQVKLAKQTANMPSPLAAVMGGSHSKRYNVTAAIIDYEAGDLSQDEIIELFQHLVDSGLVWQLQGSYGRTARDLIESGEVIQ